MRYYEDLSDDQIAAALGCATGTVRSLISRALKELRVQHDPPEALPADTRTAKPTPVTLIALSEKGTA